MHSTLLLPLVLQAFFQFSYAQHFTLEGRRSAAVGGLGRRGNVDGTVTLTDSNDITYLTNLTLGGESFSVIIDTGSSDLWVSPPNDTTVPGSIDTGFNTSISYASGSAAGFIKLAALTFASYSVENQSYIEVPSSQNKVGASVAGLIGLGPNINSNIEATLNNSAGYGPLDRIFRQNLTTPNFITFLLGRILDVTDVFPGDMTVGSVLDGYEAVESEPTIPLEPTAAHYQFRGEADSIISNGDVVEVTTVVPFAKDINRPTIVLDTGFTLNQVPKNLSAAFYSCYDGAELTNVTGLGEVWTVPCTTEVNISFKFAGKTIPIHPLDATLNPELAGVTNVTNSQGVSACIGSFQPISFDSGNVFDMLFGMAFIRNVYMYINLGDFVAGDNDTVTRGKPFVKFLATTDPKEAHTDFLAIRGTPSAITNALVDASDDAESADVDSTVDKIGKTNIIIIAAIGGALMLSLVALGLFCCAKKRKQKAAKHSAYRVVLEETEAHSDLEPFKVYGDYGSITTREINNSALYDPHAVKLGSS